MRWRLAFVVQLVVLCGLVLVGPGVARADFPVGFDDDLDTDCANIVVPVDAISGTGAQFASGAGGALAYAAGSVKPTMVPGGATLFAAAGEATTAGGTAVAGKLVLGAAAFLAASYGTCKWLDWITADANSADALDLQTWADTTVNPPQPCTDFVSGGTGRVCRTVVFDTAQTINTNVYFNLCGSFTASGVTIPQLTPTNGLGPYPWPAPSTAQCTPAATPGIPQFVSPAYTGFCNSGSTSGTCGNVNRGTRIITSFTCQWDLGDVCGVTPGLSVYLASGTSGGSGSYTAIVSAWPELFTTGWRREIVSDVQCRDSGWIRATSSPYWDKLVTSRVPVPTCPEGEYPIQVRIHRKPTNAPNCTTLGDTCWSATTEMFRWVAPTALQTSGTAPEWGECLAVGNECSPPAVVEGACVWGGHTVDMGFCTGERAGTGVNTEPITTPSDNATVTPNPYVEGDPGTTVGAPAVDPPDPPDSGTITVPIDGGNGPRPGDTPLDIQEDECWPDGWSWFNPAEWVLRPVRCALEWAFVPDPDVIGESFDAFMAELEGQFPFSLMFEFADFAGALGDSINDHSGPGCFDMPGSWSFGPAGTSSIGDVCIGDGFTVTPTQRQMVAVLFVGPIVWAVCQHAVNMIRRG